MEPWDGPASVAFTDGRVVGATLDRNGLRPGRWVETTDGYVVLGSESGLLDIPPEQVRRLGRLQPGKLFLVDLERGRIVEDEEVKREVATAKPYGEWYERNAVPFKDLPPSSEVTLSDQPLRLRQRAFGYTQEDLRVLLAPMAIEAQEPVGSMGNDLSLAVLSDQAPPLFSYFKQLFAQVTNPPIDPIREEIVMSLATSLGNERNLFDETPEHAHKLLLDQPILLNRELETLRHVDHEVYKARTIDATWLVQKGPGGMVEALERLCRTATEAIEEGANILILNDRLLGPRRVPIPSLLAVAAVHHHLVLEGTRLRAGIIVESGEPREVHHFATLIGYGASAINPYLLLETLDELVIEGRIVRRGKDGETIEIGAEDAAQNLVKAIGKGLLKTISKMGISTIQSYRSAQIFEAVGLERELIDTYFTGTASRIGGVGLQVLAEEALERHARAYPVSRDDLLPVGGVYAWRRDGEHHMWNPETIALVQHAVRSANGDVNAALGGDEQALGAVRESPAMEKYREYARAVNDDAARKATLRGLLEVGAGPGPRPDPIPLEEVEPAKEIVRRFCTGAMSLGSISREAHETLAIAMNRLGGRSNTGEGGEDPVRFTPDPNGDRRRSAIKQVASGRFGVTIHYLVNADELQIKMAQGAKPGEGGQLPGHKVDEYIGSIRHTTPGVGLISPPPHHDIYSIEDLKQLIYDLRCGNPKAQVSVKLVAEVGVGTVAAGVSKANADRVLIAGHDGGTGASPLSSIQAAGVPWEIGLAETQQTLLLNDLRSRIVVQTDGQLKTGRDVVVAAMLGADEMGFSTAPLIATGCIMMRACHLNTCPVGIATQDPELRKRFKGTPEHVVNFFFFIAEEVREILASLGLRTLDEAIGRVDLLGVGAAVDHWKARGVDLTHLLTHIELAERPAPPPRRTAAAGARRRARLGARAGRRAGARARRARAGGAARAQPQPLRRRDPLQPRRLPARRRGAARGHDRGRARGLGRAELRRLARARRHVHAVRRRAGLRRQGPVRGRVRDPPARRHGRALPRRGERRRRQHRPLRGDGRARVLPRSRGRALRRAQLGRVGRRRGRRRPRMRVHDRRSRRRAGADRAQLRGRHERRVGLCPGREGRVPGSLQHGHGGLRRALRGRRDRAARDDRRARRADRQPGRGRRAGALGAAARGQRLREGDAARLQARAARAGRGRGRRGRHRRRARGERRAAGGPGRRAAAGRRPDRETLAPLDVPEPASEAGA